MPTDMKRIGARGPANGDYLSRLDLLFGGRPASHALALAGPECSAIVVPSETTKWSRSFTRASTCLTASCIRAGVAVDHSLKCLQDRSIFEYRSPQSECSPNQATREIANKQLNASRNRRPSPPSVCRRQECVRLGEAAEEFGLGCCETMVLPHKLKPFSY